MDNTTTPTPDARPVRLQAIDAQGLKVESYKQQLDDLDTQIHDALIAAQDATSKYRGLLAQRTTVVNKMADEEAKVLDMWRSTYPIDGGGWPGQGGGDPNAQAAAGASSPPPASAPPPPVPPTNALAASAGQNPPPASASSAGSGSGSSDVPAGAVARLAGTGADDPNAQEANWPIPPPPPPSSAMPPS